MVPISTAGVKKKMAESLRVMSNVKVFAIQDG